MKKIIFDLLISQPVLGSKFHGGGEYAKTVFNELCNNYSHKIQLIAFFDPKRYLDDWIFEAAKENNVKMVPVQTYADVSSHEDFKSADKFIACLMSGVDKVKIPKQMKIIGVYHGFRSLEKPIDWTSPLYESSLKNKLISYTKLICKKKYYERKYQQQKKYIELCDEIIGVSEHSGYAAEMFFPEYDKSHIHVFYSPQKHIDYVEDVNKVVQEKTILMLGGDRWVKNVYRGIKAADELFSNNQLEGYIVKIVGGVPSSIYKKIKNKEKFISLSYLSTEDLEKQYAACDFFFYPTLNEGFGYPPQEVMNYGKTCVISGINSLIEVYRDSVYYCNPYDINEMKCRLLQASEQKISEKIILKNMERITLRQDKDLRKLCDLICQ